MLTRTILNNESAKCNCYFTDFCGGRIYNCRPVAESKALIRVVFVTLNLSKLGSTTMLFNLIMNCDCVLCMLIWSVVSVGHKALLLLDSIYC